MTQHKKHGHLKFRMNYVNLEGVLMCRLQALLYTYTCQSV